jgi:hypothetical protein
MDNDPTSSFDTHCSWKKVVEGGYRFTRYNAGLQKEGVNYRHHMRYKQKSPRE